MKVIASLIAELLTRAGPNALIDLQLRGPELAANLLRNPEGSVSWEEEIEGYGPGRPHMAPYLVGTSWFCG